MSEQLIYGIHAVSAVLNKSSGRVRKLVVNCSRQDKRMQDLRVKARDSKLFIEEVSATVMQKLYPEFVHQGVVAYVDPGLNYTEKDIPNLIGQIKSKALILILDGITDPHNLGACLRVSDAAGVDFVIIPKDKNAELTPLVRKIASGAAEFVPVITVTNLARVIKKLKSLGVWVYGTHLDAKQSLYDTDLTDHAAIVFGSEGCGMRHLTTQECDFLCDVPMLGSVGSLNVAVACGVFLYEAVRQRR